MNQHDTTNRLLAHLSPSDCAAATERGIIVELERGRDLAAAGDPIDHCWFPLSGLVSVIAANSDGKVAEVGVIGREGMVNAGVVTRLQRSPMRLLVQIASAALRVSERIIVAAAADRPAVAKLLIAYNQVLGVQAAFSALAYAQYTLPQRLPAGP